MRWTRSLAAVALTISAIAPTAEAQFTTTSPAGGALPSGVSSVGGIVSDLIGTNGNRVVSQLAASTLFNGNQGSASRLTIGTQAGFNAATLAALGGGLSQASFRITLFDGDNAPGDTEDGENFLLVNNADVGNFTNVQTVRTSSTGVVTVGSEGPGFNNGQLRTGFFFTNNVGALSTIFSGLAGGSLVFEFGDLVPGDFNNALDFRQGLDASLIDVGTGPVVTPPNIVPEPQTYALMAAGLLGVAGLARRRRAA